MFWKHVLVHLGFDDVLSLRDGDVRDMVNINEGTRDN
jgi:hypothetical protein